MGPRAGTTVWGRGRDGSQGWDYSRTKEDLLSMQSVQGVLLKS